MPDSEENFLGPLANFALFKRKLTSSFLITYIKVWLAIFGVLCVGLSIGVSFGIASACGIFYGPIHSTLPFLLLGKCS